MECFVFFRHVFAQILHHDFLCHLLINEGRLIVMVLVNLVNLHPILIPPSWGGIPSLNVALRNERRKKTLKNPLLLLWS